MFLAEESVVNFMRKVLFQCLLLTVVEMKNVFAALCVAFVENIKKSDKSVNRERDEHKF